MPIAITLLSAAALALELLLMRLLSVLQWHHFAWMVISLALLGYGAAGAVLSIAREWLLARFRAAFIAHALLFGAMSLICFALAQRIPFNALELFWNLGQLPRLFAIYLLLAIPFYCASMSIALAFARSGASVGRIYRADLVGGAMGAAGLMIVLFHAPPNDALLAVSFTGFAAAAVAIAQVPERQSCMTAGAALVVLATAFVALRAIPESLLELRASEFKDLRQTLRVPGSHVVDERFSPLAVVTTVENLRTPFRYAPGLSLAFEDEPPAQLAVFADGNSAGFITRIENAAPGARLPFMDAMTAALSYHVRPRPRTLVVGGGTGFEVLDALAHGSPRVDATEVDPSIVDVVRTRFHDYSGNLYRRSDVELHPSDARRFLATSTRRFDVIAIALVDPFSASAATLQSMNENTLYTIEGMRAALARLEPGGVVAITRWMNVPPRDALRLVATVSEALRAEGKDPSRRIVAIRSWKTTTLLVKNDPVTAGEIRTARDFCERRSFDIDYFPGIRLDETNRFNVLDESYLHDGIAALLGAERETFIRRYKFAIAPPTDDRPYFFEFLRWQSLPELFRLRTRGGMALSDWGSVVVLATLVQAVMAATICILVPLLVSRRGGTARSPLVICFGSIGMAYFFIEIAFIQKLTLILGHPIYSISVVIAGFLFFSGLGSGMSQRFERHAVAPFAAIAISAMALILLVPHLLAIVAPLPDLARAGVCLLLLAPLAFFMGMPFPIALRRVAEHEVPLSWGINASASVVSTALATLIAMEFGMVVLVIASLVFYAAAFRALGSRAFAAPGSREPLPADS